MSVPKYQLDYCKNCWDISVKNKNVNLMVSLEEKSEDHQSHLDSSSGDHERLCKISWQSGGFSLVPTSQICGFAHFLSLMSPKMSYLSIYLLVKMHFSLFSDIFWQPKSCLTFLTPSLFPDLWIMICMTWNKSPLSPLQASLQAAHCW